MTLLAALFLGANRSTADRPGDRRIALYNIHNKETIDLVYKREGKYLPDAMKRINWFLRDWRQNKPTKMDPKLIDLLWEIRTELGTRVPTHVISGYRSPKTNAMLRKTRGGQARKSQHTLGKALDIHFPDVPVKRLRYSALIRERGGVGYYPTSAIPFVHIDTGRTRHWPRMPRYELALLFPNGKSRHVPSDGRRINKADVKKARAKHKTLAVQIASFHEFRRAPQAPRPTLLASGWGANVKRNLAGAEERPPLPKKELVRPRQELRLASLGALPLVPPRPRAVTRPSANKKLPGPSNADRRQLNSLFALASLGGSAPKPAARRGSVATSAPSPSQDNRPANQRAREIDDPIARTLEEARTSRLGLSAGAVRKAHPTIPKEELAGWSNGFAAAPAFDEEHPDELFYRPFALGPLLTETPSSDDPALAHLQAPDVAATLELLDEETVTLPMRFIARQQVAEAMWSHQFTGRAVNPMAAALSGGNSDQGQLAASGLASRSVRTSLR
ncbi:MAG: DUF882 domain-containing protein [Filomicrobium sp.]